MAARKRFQQIISEIHHSREKQVAIKFLAHREICKTPAKR
jgi:hypothetical protein